MTQHIVHPLDVGEVIGSNLLISKTIFELFLLISFSAKKEIYIWSNYENDYRSLFIIKLVAALIASGSSVFRKETLITKI